MADRWVMNASPLILLAHSGFTAVLDDLKARKKAKSLWLAVIGTVGIILRAKQRGLIPSAKPALERLRGAGAHLSDVLVKRAIELAGEA